ncbi:class I SAM-dependent methyltransferase [Desulfobacterota bacterium AH_259_B03_O07]|nr:class I SAM-dependent methyltransferase [Desulfobacterota bacterium AH_259_B03_O07]
MILCFYVLEHVEDDRKAMKELFRVLKPGGWAILQVPIFQDRAATFEDPSIISPEERESVFGKKDHVRIYGLDFKDRLECSGFKVFVDNYVSTLNPEVVKRCGLDPTEKIFFCTKTI